MEGTPSIYARIVECNASQSAANARKLKLPKEKDKAERNHGQSHENKKNQ